MAAPTGSRKIDAIVARAERAGLEVELEVKDSEFTGDTTYRSVSLKVRRQRRIEHNLLDQVRNADEISVAWGWPRLNGATPKMVYCKQHSLFSSRDLRASVLPYAVSGLAE